MDILNNWPWPLRVNTFFATFFFLLVVFTVVCLIVLRTYKNKRERNKRNYQERTDALLNNCLFDDQLDVDKEIQQFRTVDLATNLQKKIAIRQLLLYNENLKGESTVALKRIFHGLHLDAFVLDSLKNGKWFHKARAIYVLSELNIKKPRAVLPYLNDRHEGVRAQAIYYFIKTAENDPLAFFSKLKKELTLWELIQIEDCLKTVYNGPVPDFSKWLDHNLSTVLIFSIRMIQQFNQFEHISSIVPFLDHPDPMVRKETVKTLYKLQYEGLLETVGSKFLGEHKLVKIEILKAVESFGDTQTLYALKPALAIQEDWQTNLMFLRAEKRMLSNP